MYVKAYLRLGAARFELKKFDTAKDAFEKALRLEPQNKTAVKELERIEKVFSKYILIDSKVSNKLTTNQKIIKLFDLLENTTNRKKYESC